MMEPKCKCDRRRAKNFNPPNNLLVSAPQKVIIYTYRSV